MMNMNEISSESYLRMRACTKSFVRPRILMDGNQTYLPLLGPLHTQDWEPVTITLQALSLVEKAERSKFASHYAWGTNIVCECKMDVKSTWIPTWHQMNHVSWLLGLFSKPPLGGRPNTKPGDHGTPNAHNHCFILIHHAWGPAWIDWNST